MRLTRLLPLVLAAALGLTGCGVTGNEVASCVSVCSKHGGVRSIQPSLRNSECYCLKDRVMAYVQDTDKIALSCDWQRAPDGGAGK